MADKLIFAFFTFAFYIVIIRVVNYILPGFIAFSNLGIIQIIVLVVAILPSLLLAKKTIEYLRG